jgi:hypothetical protein
MAVGRAVIRHGRWMTVVPGRIDSHRRRSLAELARRQDDVVRRDQLLAVGLAAHEIDYMVESRRWQVDADGLVIVLHNGPLTRRQQEAVAVLAGGRLCALAARTAAARAGLQGWAAELVEVVVPRGTTYPPLALVEVKVHESRRFGVEDLHPSAWPPRVPIERALVDAACWSRMPRTACGVLAAGVQQRLTTSERLMEALELAGKVKFHQLLKRALVDIGGGAHAMSEIDFIRFCARNGLPKPKHQRVRRDLAGRRRYIDAVLAGPAGEVKVEIDGALHLVVQTYWDDMYRGNEMTIVKDGALRFPSYVIYANDEQALDQIRRALGLSGPGKKTAA